jgi:hypothetical protein
MLNWNELKTIAVKVANKENPYGMDRLNAEYENAAVGEMTGGSAVPRFTSNEQAALEAVNPSNKPEVVPPEEGPGFMDSLKDYMPSLGYGAAGGAIAGIPIALLINALTGDSKKKNLRSYLKSGLLGALLGGGLGAGGGALYKSMTGLNIGEPRMSEPPEEVKLQREFYDPLMPKAMLEKGVKTQAKKEQDKAKKKDMKGTDADMKKNNPKGYEERQKARGFE